MNGFADPVGDDGAGDAAGGALLAEIKQDVGDRLHVILAQDVGGRTSARLHPHVERSVEPERKAARRLIELHRRHSDVEDDPVRRLDAETSGDRVELAEARFREPQPAAG